MKTPPQIRLPELLFDLTLLSAHRNDEITRQFRRGVVFSVVADARELPENPRKRIVALDQDISRHGMIAGVACSHPEHRLGHHRHAGLGLDIDIRLLGVVAVTEI